MRAAQIGKCFHHVSQICVRNGVTAGGELVRR